MRVAILVSALMLSACGVADVGTTAATAAKLQAEQAKQGQETMDKIKTDLEGAMKAGEQRAAGTAAPQQARD